MVEKKKQMTNQEMKINKTQNVTENNSRMCMKIS